MEVLYKVDKWASSEDDILLIEVTKQTDKTVWYGHAGREIKELKSSKYYQYFTSKTDAISFIDYRNAIKKLSQDKERIRNAAPALLESLEELLYGTFPDGVDDDGSGRIGFSDACVKRYNKAKAAIAAARGE